jgi:circadian clock protein KaiB
MNRRVRIKFRLYVANHAQNSTKAIANLTALCREYLPNRHEIEIVDVYKDPMRALADGVLMTPTLIRVSPLPSRRIVGTLSQTQLVLDALGLEPAAA